MADGKTPAKTVNDCIIEFFEAHPNKEMAHDDVVDYVFKFIPKARDPWRAVRMLYQKGYLIYVRKGVYLRKPGYKGSNVTAPFSTKIKEAIFKRDNYRCVVCDNGPHNGHEIHADHIKPQAMRGKSTIENGQTLCSEHNMMKKRYGTLDFLKKYSEKMLALAQQYDDEDTQKLFLQLLEVLKKHESHKKSHGKKSI
jgi:hypothetical protein